MGFFAVLFSVLDVQSDSNPSSMVNVSFGKFVRLIAGM
jgi:hypothetical protein